MKELLFGFLLGINALTFLLYGLDKWKAKHHKWRIPEKTLLGIALLGGSLGALCGMRVFHHKTKHWQFRILIPVFIVLHSILLFYLLHVR